MSEHTARMIVQCDFDGTVTRNNLSVLLRERFAPDPWRKIDADYLDGKLTVESSNILQFSMIVQPRTELEAFVREHIDVRAGFIDFVRYCRMQDVPFVIVSSGLDFYIEAALDSIGLADVELHCAQTTFGDDGIHVRYADPEGRPIDSGFKLRHLEWLRQRGGNVVYLGDGQSDLESARQADHVFATDYLWEKLKDDPRCHAFDDFHDVIRQMPGLL